MTSSSRHHQPCAQLVSLVQPLTQQAWALLRHNYSQLDQPSTRRAVAQLCQQLPSLLDHPQPTSDSTFNNEFTQLMMSGANALSPVLGLLKQLRSLALDFVAKRLDQTDSLMPLQQRMLQLFDHLELGCCQQADAAVPPAVDQRLHHPLFNNSHSMMLLIDPVTGDIVDANPAACDYYGYSHSQMVGRNIATINTLSPDEIQQEIQRAQECRRHCFHFRHQLADQQIREVEVYSGPLVLDGRTLLYSIIYDISERIGIEEHLHKVMAAVEHSPSSIVITNRNGEIEYVNQYFCELTGYSQAEVLGRNPRMFQGNALPAGEVIQLWSTILRGQVWRGVFHNRKKNGELFWERASIAPVRDRNGEISYFVAVKEDITQQKKMEEKIWHQAHYDALTDLPNRFLFYQQVNDVMQHSRRQDCGAALLFIDLDGFKQVNDSLGHDAGDQLLQQVARRLRQTVRETDTAARLGGDEFTIILHHTKGLQAARHAAHKVLKQLQLPFTLDGQMAAITGSIGLAMFRDHGQVDSLVKQADRAMFEAKRRGRNQVVSGSSD